MQLLLLNQNWFAAQWRAQGHTVITAGLTAGLDVRLPFPLVHIDTIINLAREQVNSKFNPDAIVYLDNSMPLMFSGFDETSIPALFYSVDAHHHAMMHRFAGLVFDRTLVAQKDYLSVFQEAGCDAHWMPLWASVDAEPSEEKLYQAVFVGNLNPVLNPHRVSFMEAVAARAPLTFKMGEWWNIFPHAEIVLNQTVKGDLNFRVFEAMSSGAMLLTEHAGNGLYELFKDGEHLIGYNRNHIDHAVEAINHALSNIPRCREIGRAGREQILKYHTAQTRADQVMEHIKQIRGKRNSNQKQYANMINLVSTGLRIEKFDSMLAIKALAAALAAGHAGLKRGEPLSQALSAYAVIGAVTYDRLVNSHAGSALLNQLHEAYPQEPLLRLALIRDRLNRGLLAAAEQLARVINPTEPQSVYATAESAIQELLIAEAQL